MIDSTVKRPLSETELEKIRTRIREVLERFPGITISMIAPHVRPYYKEWREMFEDMIKKGEVIRETVGNGRRISFVHRLSDSTSPVEN